MSAKAEYAVRAMVQLATVDEGVLVKTDDLAKAQGIPPQFLVDILSDLRTDRLVRSHRGRDGGYELARPAAEISLADVLRCMDRRVARVAGQHAIGARTDKRRRRSDRRTARARREDGRRLLRSGRAARSLP
jgi:Rrf2 family protein